MGAIVVERKYFTCPSRESNPGRWIKRQTLYHVAVKADFYRKAVEVYYIIPRPCDKSEQKVFLKWSCKLMFKFMFIFEILKLSITFN